MYDVRCPSHFPPLQYLPKYLTDLHKIFSQDLHWPNRQFGTLTNPLNLTLPYLNTLPYRCLTLPYHTILPFTLFNPTLNLLDPTNNFHPFTLTTLTFTLSNPTLDLLVTLAYSQLNYPTLPFNYTFHSFPLNLTMMPYSNLPSLIKIAQCLNVCLNVV